MLTASKTSTASSRVSPRAACLPADVEPVEAQLRQLRPEFARDRALAIPVAGEGGDVFGAELPCHVEDRDLLFAEYEIHDYTPSLLR
jgi:hypothetical protein